jgi:uncharacterized repeat protein (TIGR02543 family)
LLLLKLNKELKMNRVNRMKTSVVVSLLLLFTACEMAGPGLEQAPGPEGKAAVRVKLEAAGIQSRTVAPDVALETVTVWELWGGKQGETETKLTEFSSTEGGVVYLEPATWSFTLKGRKEGGVILTGNIPGQAISLEGPNVLSFTVAPVSDGQGTVNIVINLPAGSGISSAKVFKDGTELDTPVTPAANRIVFAGSYAAGDYYFSFRLYNDDDLYGVVSELIQVRANLESAKEYTLNQADLNLTYLITYYQWDGQNGTETGYYRYTDAALILPDPPARRGYSFGGWYDNAGLTGSAVTTIPRDSTGDKSFYARWDPGASVQVALQPVPADPPLLDSSLFMKEEAQFSAGSGYESWAWYWDGTAIEGANTSVYTLAAYSKAPGIYELSVVVTTGAGASLSARCRVTVKAITVTFDADGGTPATQAKTVSDDGLVGAANMPADPVKSGYGFGGWYTQRNGGGTRFTGTTPVIENDIRVYAKWTVQYTVTFDADGGSPAAQTKTVTGGGSTVGVDNMPDEPTKSEYRFDGWYTQQNGGGSRFSATSAITENITLYAKWVLAQYTVTFNADRGSPASQTKMVNSGDSVGSANMPSDPTRSGYTFGGWYTAKDGGGSGFTATTTVTRNITVYAQWTFIPMPDNLSLTQALTWLDTNAADGKTYTITLSAVSETIAPKTLSYGGKTVSVTLSGGDSERMISLGSNGSLFTVGSGVTLILDNNVTLLGKSNNAPLVRVASGGTLEMKAGSKISGNTSSSSSYYGGGVYVSGTFIMSGGTISGNSVSSSSSSYGGGVYVSGGTFIMSGGTISGNTSSSSSSSSSYASYGGGVYVSGTFTMSGGTISGNTASSSYAYAYGGGVYVGSGSFTKQSGGIIYGSNALDPALKNTAKSDSYGHAVYVGISPTKKRDATAGEGVTLNSAAIGAAGGWE